MHKTAIQQQQNHRLTTNISLRPPPPGRGGGGGKCILLAPNLALDYVVVKTKMLLSSQRNYLIKLTHFDETKERAHASQIARAKENPKLSYGGPSQGQTN